MTFVAKNHDFRGCYIRHRSVLPAGFVQRPGSTGSAARRQQLTSLRVNVISSPQGLITTNQTFLGDCGIDILTFGVLLVSLGQAGDGGYRGTRGDSRSGGRGYGHVYNLWSERWSRLSESGLDRRRVRVVGDRSPVTGGLRFLRLLIFPKERIPEISAIVSNVPLCPDLDAVCIASFFVMRLGSSARDAGNDGGGGGGHCQEDGSLHPKKWVCSGQVKRMRKGNAVEGWWSVAVEQAASETRGAEYI